MAIKLIIGLKQRFLKKLLISGEVELFGIDCSGLVQVCLQSANIIIPRNSMDQLKFSSNIFLIQNNR